MTTLGDVSHLIPLSNAATSSAYHITTPLPRSNQNIAPSHVSNSTFYPSHAQNHDPANLKRLKCIWTPVGLFVAGASQCASVQQQAGVKWTNLDQEGDEDGLYAVLHSDNSVFESSGGFRFLTFYNAHCRSAETCDHKDGRHVKRELDMFPTEGASFSVHNPVTGRR